MEDEALEARIQYLERVVARLMDDRSVGSVRDGTLSLKWKQRAQGPTGEAYILVRQAGGNAAFVAAASAVDSDWSNA